MIAPRTLPAPKPPRAASVIRSRSPQTKHHSTVGQAKQALAMREVRYWNVDTRGPWTYDCDVAVYLYNADAGVYTLAYEAKRGDVVDREALNAALAR